MTGSPPTVAIAMPRLSDAMQEGTILRWLKAPGDAVARGDALVEVETDKATMVYEAEADGVLGALLVGEGEVAPLGAPIAELLVTGAPPQPVAAPAPAPAPTPVPARAAPAATRPRATPVARRAAAELGVDLRSLAGTGPSGRIVRADVLAAAGPGPARAGAPGDVRVDLTPTQRTIASRMVASRTEVPEFVLTREVDMTAALALRHELGEAGCRVSVNDLVVKAAALALREHPKLNASWGGDHVVRHARVNVGIAVATDDALLVPTIPDADRKSLPEVAATARALTERARTRTATPADLGAATFTVSNLGMLGVSSFTAVVDLPQVAILAAGAVLRRPVFGPAEEVVARDLMQLTLTCDHRAVYGSDGARFLGSVARRLERPTLLLLAPAETTNGEEAR